jgi:MoaA/NifB/PqqE/SkfB family radical SAM enzyme
VVMPCFASRSTAGPDAGLAMHSFEFDGTRVRLEVSRDPECPVRLAEADGDFSILLDGETYLEGVKVLPTMAHAPNQAFLNMDSRCKYNCAFCNSPVLERGAGTELGAERAMRIIAIAAKQPGFQGLALTSGIPDSCKETNKRLADVVRGVKAAYPEVPIGVEAYFEELDDILMMKDAGAEELKLNVEAWPEGLFVRVCPQRDRNIILAGLEEAVRVFGKCKVSSNVIYGLGETDDELEEGVRYLADIGAVANLRMIRINQMNRARLSKAVGFAPEPVKAERMLKLGRMHKKVLEERGLTTLGFKTMCFPCQCCDLVPFRDL